MIRMINLTNNEKSHKYLCWKWNPNYMLNFTISVWDLVGDDFVINYVQLVYFNILLNTGTIAILHSGIRTITIVPDTLYNTKYCEIVALEAL